MNHIFDALPGIIMSALKSPGFGTYTMRDGTTKEIELNFDESFVQIVEQDGLPVEALRKAATIKKSDIPTPRHGDTLTYGGEAYTVRGISPAGGLTTLILSE